MTADYHIVHGCTTTFIQTYTFTVDNIKQMYVAMPKFWVGQSCSSEQYSDRTKPQMQKLVYNSICELAETN